MTTGVRIVCFLIVAAAIYPWLSFAAFSPLLFESRTPFTTYLIARSLIVFGLIWIVPFWVVFFAWRTIKNWRLGSILPALLMALPGVVLAGVVLYLKFGPA